MFSIDITSRIPIFKQLEQNILNFISVGVLKPNEQLPSVRSLAQELKINPNTVQKAYTSLEQKDLVYIIAGRGVFISEKCTYIASVQALISVKLKDVSKEAKDVGISLEEQQKIVSSNYKEGLI